MTKQALLKGCKQGDRLSQAELYQRYHKELYGICLRYASNREEAKYLLKDVFIHIYKYLYKHRPTMELGVWMRNVTVYLILQHLLGKSPLFPSVASSEVAEDYFIIDQLPADQKNQILLNALQQLPDGYRAIFNLYAIEEQSHKEIEEEMGISDIASKFQLSKAKALLNDVLSGIS